MSDKSALSEPEMLQARSALSQWASPIEFANAVAHWKGRVPSREIFWFPKLNFLLEAWVLARFALLRPVERVRLSAPNEQWPDGYIETAGISSLVEIVSMDVPGRRIGDEHQNWTPGIWKHDPVEDWIARADAIPEALEIGLQKKALKRYATEFTLVAYLLPQEYGIRQGKIELAIAEAKARHAATFKEIWVLWKDKVL